MKSTVKNRRASLYAQNHLWNSFLVQKLSFENGRTREETAVRSGNLELQREQLILNSAHKTVNKIVKLRGRQSLVETLFYWKNFLH